MIKIPFLSLAFLSSAAWSQTDSATGRIPVRHKSYEQGTFITTFSFGFINDYRNNNSLPAGFEKSNTSGFVPVSAKLEYGVSNHFSLAADFGYDAFICNFKQVYRGNNGPFTRYKTNNTRILSGGIIAFYHFTDLLRVPGLDPFIGLGASLNNIRYSAYPTADTTVPRIDHTVTPYLKAGARYFLTDKFSLFGDVGYDKHTVFSLGFSVRFVKTKYHPDTDHDGIPDYGDSCVVTHGIAKFHGCPDSDSDGVQDSEDSCVYQAGLALYNGCPDSDGDKIPDKADACPQQAGLMQFRGCPDIDGDGIPDKDDACPDKVGTAGFAGCPDTDGDGLPDKDDECPFVFGAIDNRGCPYDTIHKSTTPELKRNHIEFALGKTTITKASYAALNEAIAVLRDDREAILYIDGYTDITGTSAVNRRISKQRAETVKKYFLKNGIAQDRIIARGNGSRSPVGNNHTRAGRAKNRRVVLKLKY